MVHAEIQALLLEYNLELDDVRWYLSQRLATEIVSYHDRPLELTMEFWSGRMADRLYDMEERFLDELGQKMTANQSDEGHVRALMAEIKVTRRRRPRL